jgi:hypothetical protein
MFKHWPMICRSKRYRVAQGYHLRAIKINLSGDTCETGKVLIAVLTIRKGTNSSPTIKELNNHRYNFSNSYRVIIKT